ncbi:MAG: HU family DNA-binding protein [Elusimicrobia bacterium]|nr:HU family DNA-binding protein [Elusimicrobiota bacterium]
MNKNDLIKSLTSVLSTRKEAAGAVEKIFADIKKRLQSDDRVVISGFGAFYIKHYKSKKLYNPKTGKEMLVSPRRKIKFKPSPKLTVEMPQ